MKQRVISILEPSAHSFSSTTVSIVPLDAHSSSLEQDYENASFALEGLDFEYEEQAVYEEGDSLSEADETVSATVDGNHIIDRDVEFFASVNLQKSNPDNQRLFEHAAPEFSTIHSEGEETNDADQDVVNVLSVGPEDCSAVLSEDFLRVIAAREGNRVNFSTDDPQQVSTENNSHSSNHQTPGKIFCLPPRHLTSTPDTSAKTKSSASVPKIFVMKSPTPRSMTRNSSNTPESALCFVEIQLQIIGIDQISVTLKVKCTEKPVTILDVSNSLKWKDQVLEISPRRMSLPQFESGSVSIFSSRPLNEEMLTSAFDHYDDFQNDASEEEETKPSLSNADFRKMFGLAN